MRPKLILGVDVHGGAPVHLVFCQTNVVISAQWFGDFFTDKRADGLTCYVAYDLAKYEADVDRIVRTLSLWWPSWFLTRDRRTLCRIVKPVTRLRRIRKDGTALVPLHMAHQYAFFAILRELWPVLGNRSVEIDLASVSKNMNR